jgi:hypothetical protein
MPNEFLNEVVAKTKAAITNTGCYTMPDPSPRLPYQEGRLFGRDAGEDYVRTHSKALKDIIMSGAESRQMELRVMITPAGEMARASMQQTFEQVLPGFNIAVRDNLLSVQWKHHLNL